MAEIFVSFLSFCAAAAHKQAWPGSAWGGRPLVAPGAIRPMAKCDATRKHASHITSALKAIKFFLNRQDRKQ
jgi:hypothetical protein